MAVLLSLGGAVAGAQASPYVPLDDAAYGLVDALQRRGLLLALPQLDRPFTVSQIRAAIGRHAPAGLDAVSRGWVLRLERTIAKYDDGRGAWDRRGDGAPAASGPTVAARDAGALTLHVNGGLQGVGASNGLREVMLADGTGGLFPGMQVRAAASGGAFTAAFRFVGDQSLTRDPEYAGFEGGLSGSQRGGPGIAGRAEEAYVSWQRPVVELFAGRLSRNWGPPAYDGLLLGRAAWSYDHAFARLGTERFRLTWLLAQLNDFGDVRRWFTARRASARWGGLELGVSESVVYSGVARPLEWALSSPLVPSLSGMYNDNEAANLNLAADAAWATRRGIVAGQAFVDDVQLDGVTRKPPMYGLTVTADALPLWGAHRWFASYTEVSNLAYRNPTAGDAYTQQFVSLGRGFSDHREVRVGADLAVTPVGTVRPYLALRWQGIGTYRNPFPPEATWPSVRTILQGPVMAVTRLAVQSTLVAVRGLEVHADLGVNAVRNPGYVSGTSRVRPEGRIRVQWEPPRWSGRWAMRPAAD